MALNGPQDPGHRYVQRMQQSHPCALWLASPAEALQAADVPEGRLDLDAFLRNVANNAHFAGILDVVCPGSEQLKPGDRARRRVCTRRRGDPYLAQRRPLPPAGSPITLTLTASESTASATLHNQGSTIAEDLLERIFELEVSDPGSPPRWARANTGARACSWPRPTWPRWAAPSTPATPRGVAFVLTFQRLG